MLEKMHPYQVAKSQMAQGVKDAAFKAGWDMFKRLQTDPAHKQIYAREKKPAYLKSAEELLLAHPEYLDDQKHYFDWFTYWYAAGYESKEEQHISQQTEYVEWY